MRLINLSNEEEKIRTMYRIVCLTSFIIIITVTTYGIVTAAILDINVIGETFVNTEFPPMIFPFYAKPVTWFMASVIVFWYSLLELNKEMISKFSKFKRQLFVLIAFFVGAMTLYEVLFNFTLWASLMSASEILGELNPDLLVNPFPNPEVPWNLVFATKIFLLITIISFYTFYFLRRIESKS
ncbi:MAG: hypothetical protein H3Z54_03675 [archaeon]|nr:hypothetical protein [archaeon]